MASDGLSSRLRSEDDSGRRSNLRRESGAELQADKGKPQDKQGGISQENADNRRLTDGFTFGHFQGVSSINLTKFNIYVKILHSFLLANTKRRS